MGFRIHRGAWQFKDAQNRFVTKYKIDSDGALKETDSSGNILDDAFMARTASANIPSEYLTQTEGDARYIRTNEVRTGTTTYSLTFKNQTEQEQVLFIGTVVDLVYLTKMVSGL